MLDFDAATFAIAGALAAAGPIVIHLLNRRRYRTLSWAAMEFLREALERNRRILHLRDLILLALRVLCVLAFGLALARPFFRGNSGLGWLAGSLFAGLLATAGIAGAAAAVGRAQRSRRVSGTVCALALVGALGLWTFATRSSRGQAEQRATARSPVHAVLVVDNSRSLAVETAAGTWLKRAQARADEFIRALPADSRISVIPLAGSEEPFPLDAYRSKDDARRAVERIRAVDVAGDVTAALEQAEQACQQVADLPTKRVAVLTDLQANAWSTVDLAAWAQRLPGLQIAPVADAAPGNVWVESLELEDGVSGTEAPCRFLARVRSNAATPLTSVQATLTVDGVEIGGQVVELGGEQTRELEFTHQFEVAGEPGRPHWATAMLELQAESLAADQLPADNRQALVVPVVEALPVVFIDQYGRAEDVEKNRIGETYALRHLLAPRLATEAAPRRLIHVQHVRPPEVDLALLESARLVVIAGVEAPGELTPLLREYALQGGPLVILAGGAFDPARWQEQAWLDGAGILPAPLKAELWGALPQQSAELKPFFADFRSMQHPAFLIEGEEPADLAAIFEATPFFVAAQADVSAAALEDLQRQETARLQEMLQTLDERDRMQAAATTASSSQTLAETARRWEPTWWQWRAPFPLWDRRRTAEELARLSQPRVWASFANPSLPWMVERRVGAGRVVLLTSGVSSDWNLLRTSSAMYAFHRLFFQLMEETLPRRNFNAGERIVVPLAPRNDVRQVLHRPNGARETLVLEALGPNVSGVAIRQPLLSGTYALVAEPTAVEANPAPSPPTREATPLCVHAAAAESDLRLLTPWDMQQKAAGADVRVLAVDEPLHLEGGVRRGQNLWKWFAAAMLGGLLLEMVVVAWPMQRQEAAA